MFIAGDKILPLTNHFAPAILGMPIVTFILVLVIVVLLGWQLSKYMIDAKKREKNIAEAKDSVLIEFTDDHGGKVERVMCKEWKGEARKEEWDSRGTFTVQNQARIKDFKHLSGYRMTHSIDSYFLISEHDHLDEYPYDVPETQRILIKKFYFTKNCPWPNIPHDAKKWDTERYVRITATMAKLAKDESNLQVLVSEMSGVFEPMLKAIEWLKSLPLIKILAFIQLGALLIIGFLSYQNMSALSNIAKFITGAK
jgi:hypothetical protein